MKRLLLGALLSNLLACVSADDTTTPAVNAPDDAEFTETVVVTHVDGTVEQIVRPITAGEERRQNELRAAGAQGAVALTGRDPSCGFSSLWLYDRTDWTGNRICFVVDGTAAEAVEFVLGRYTRTWVYLFGWRYPDKTWSIPRGSIWPGMNRGALAPSTGFGVDANIGQPPGISLYFEAWGPRTTFDWAPDDANNLLLFPP